MDISNITSTTQLLSNSTDANVMDYIWAISVGKVRAKQCISLEIMKKIFRERAKIPTRHICAACDLLFYSIKVAVKAKVNFRLFSHILCFEMNKNNCSNRVYGVLSTF